VDLKKIELKYFFQFFIAIIVVFFVFELNYYRHWTSIEDQDLTLIHNSLLLNSGEKAEYHDHPGHTKILFLSLWLNLLEIIKILNISSYNDFKFSDNIKNDFTKLVIYSRFLNALIGILFVYVFYNLNKVLTKNKNRSYLLSILFITSFPFLNSISHIRTELLSSVFIFFSFLYLFKLVSKDNLKRKYIFYIGFFLILSIFSKFQSIFIFLFFPIFLSLIKKKRIEIKKIFFEQKKIHFYLSIIFFTGIFLIWFKYSKGINLVFFPIFIIYFYICLTYVNKKYFKNNQIYFIFLYNFFLGICLAFILLYSLKPFHTNNIGMIANFFGASSMFIQGSNPYELGLIDAVKLINRAFLSFLFYVKITFISYSFNEIIFLLLSFVSLYFVNKKDKKFLKNFLKFILFLFAIIFIFSVRPQKNYLIYFVPFIYLFFNYSFTKLNSKYLYNCLIILLILINFIIGMDFIKKQKFISQEDLICNENALNKTSYYYDRMRLEIFPFACKKY
jgi:hypothetical protein